MSSVPVIVKHGGKRYNLDIDINSNGETFKYQVFSVTGVEPERQKIIVKGGQLKDDAEMSKLGIKPNHAFMMMGTPSGDAHAIEKPKEQVKFLEDMTDAEIAKSEGAIPAGLQNLGNTCYMNSTLQALRAIPELHQELVKYQTSSATPGGIDLSQFGLSNLGSSTDLTASLRDLYTQMSETQEGFPPLMFLNTFRTAFPQFAEKTRDGRGYAQQDAEEAWSQIVTSLQQKLRAGGAAEADTKGFIDEYLGGRFERTEICTDPDVATTGEDASKRDDEPFFKLSCHVSPPDVRHLRDGISSALTETYTKTSATLGREASYTTTSRVARLPKYLPVHFVRFYWKRDLNKKAKVLKKVTFPHELDCVEYCTDALRDQLLPVRDKVRHLRKEEEDVERARKRQRRAAAGEHDGERSIKAAPGPVSDSTAAKAKATNGASATPRTGEASQPAADAETYKTDAQLEAERAAAILAAKREVLAAVSPALLADRGANQTGLYELRGVVTHAGASADSGHYTAYVKKEGKRDAVTGKRGEEDGRWWWFNDDKVSEVDADKIDTLAGGGESHSALILLYKAIELPIVGVEEEKKAEVKV